MQTQIPLLYIFNIRSDSFYFARPILEKCQKNFKLYSHILIQIAPPDWSLLLFLECR